MTYQSNKKEEFNIIKKAVKEHVPKLAEFIDRNETLLDYSKSLYSNNIPVLTF